MDVGTLNGWKLDDVVPAEEMVSMIDAEMPLEAVEGSYRGEVANRYRYRDGSGEIGIIASVTKPFCGDCTRLRLSPDGTIYTCLFASVGMDLREPLRAGASDEELAGLVSGRWGSRDDRYSEVRASMTERPPREGGDVPHRGVGDPVAQNVILCSRVSEVSPEMMSTASCRSISVVVEVRICPSLGGPSYSTQIASSEEPPRNGRLFHLGKVAGVSWQTDERRVPMAGVVRGRDFSGASSIHSCSRSRSSMPQGMK